MLQKLEELWQEVRHGRRLLAKNRTFTIIVSLTLALGPLDSLTVIVACPSPNGSTSPVLSTLAIVAGSPAKEIGRRDPTLDYRVDYCRLFA